MTPNGFLLQADTLEWRIVIQRDRQRPGSSERRLDLILHALSHRTRRRLLARLSSGSAMIGDLARPFDMTRVAVSKHLRVLEKARLITRTIDGRVHRCALRPEPLREVEQWLADYRVFWTQTLESLARHTESEGKP
jgi:DNA-binding transcriptional ArsR family regulator